MIYSYEEYKKLFELSSGYPIVYNFVKKSKDTGLVLESSNLLFKHRKEVIEYLQYRIAARPNESMEDFTVTKSIMMCRWPATVNMNESKLRDRVTFDDFD